MTVHTQATDILTQSVAWIGLILLVVALAFILGFGSIIIYRLLKYKTKVTILDHVGDSHMISNDIAQEVNDKDGKNYLQLLKSKIRIPVPNPDKYLSTGIKKLLFLHKHNNLLTPMNVSHSSPAKFNFNMDDLVSVLL